MTFESILFRRQEERREDRDPPDYFGDLNLDAVVRAITAGREQYDLAPFFHSPLGDIGAIAYRQEVMRDLEDEAVTQAIAAFSWGMRTSRERVAQSRHLRYRYEQERWFLSAADVYRAAVRTLNDVLAKLELRSRGLRGFRGHLAEYVASDGFGTLCHQVEDVRARLSAIRYCLLIEGDTITVRPYAGEADHAAAVEETFERFRRGAATEHSFKFADWGGMNHIEAAILEHVAQLHPEAFGALDAFCAAYAEFADKTLSTFDREVQFYVAYLEHVRRLRQSGLVFCYPRVSATSKDVSGRGVFDIALAAKLASEGRSIVRNDFFLRDPERIFVVSGPNQGGKTTFARAFGQLHHLAALGLPVPGSDARLFLFDRLFTHFERNEDVTNLRGKLHDDLVRIRRVLESATPRSVLIMNEIFASTTVKDAVFLSRKIIAEVSALDLLTVCVTFLGELSTFDEKTVSLVAAVDPANPAIRTFELERRPANGLAYALAIAERHRVTYGWLTRRIGS